MTRLLAHVLHTASQSSKAIKPSREPKYLLLSIYACFNLTVVKIIKITIMENQPHHRAYTHLTILHLFCFFIRLHSVFYSQGDRKGCMAKERRFFFYSQLPTVHVDKVKCFKPKVPHWSHHLFRALHPFPKLKFSQQIHMFKTPLSEEIFLNASANMQTKASSRNISHETYRAWHTLAVENIDIVSTLCQHKPYLLCSCRQGLMITALF